MARENPWKVLATAAVYNTLSMVLWPFTIALAVLVSIRNGLRALGRTWRRDRASDG